VGLARTLFALFVPLPGAQPQPQLRRPSDDGRARPAPRSGPEERLAEGTHSRQRCRRAQCDCAAFSGCARSCSRHPGALVCPRRIAIGVVDGAVCGWLTLNRSGYRARTCFRPGAITIGTVYLFFQYTTARHPLEEISDQSARVCSVPLCASAASSSSPIAPTLIEARRVIPHARWRRVRWRSHLNYDVVRTRTK